MRRLIHCWTVFCVFTCFSLVAVQTALASGADDGTVTEHSVGVATADITPAYPVRLNGFGGRSKESEGVRQQLWAKALAVGTNDQDTVVVITVDTLGIPDDLTERLAKKLVSHGLNRSRLGICASHTHSGPMIQNCANTLFGQPISTVHWDNILKYSAELESKLEQVAIAALADRRPSRLSWGIGKVKFAQNRRTAGGPVDHDLPLLAVHDITGQLRAVFTNYACHCVTLSDDWISGDWAGYAMDHIQRRNPGCVALISIGCGADANPRGGVLGSKFDVADSLGQELAEEVQRLLSTPLQPLKNAPVAMLERVTLPLAPLPTRAQWEERAAAQNAIGYHARTQLGRLDRGEAMMTEISYPVQSIAFGDELAWIFLPGEVVVDYALRLKQELDGAKVWMNAYSNACPGYVPSERILREGGYEGGGAMVYYDISGPYATGVEQIIVDAVNKQLKQKFAPAVDVSKTDGIEPLAPADAVLSLKTKPGYHVELVASEPLIESPVAIAFGIDGRLWVAEMNDYPQGRAEGESGGQIRCVHDDDGDGRYDRSELFLTGIPFPTGVTVWRNGVLVCAAPDILYAEDTDGNGQADVVRKLFTGFATHNFQARVNSLEYGLDGWVYGSCGLFGGEITSVATGDVIALGQRDFRFHPDTGIMEPASGATQQGRVRNDWGDWFGCNNTNMLMHYPLASHYLQRNPWLAPAQSVINIAAGPDPGRLFSLSNQVLFMLSGPPNRPTAACGLGIYRDALLGEEYSQNAFTCEPVNNLVHRQVLIPQAATFSSRRAEDEQDREFLASSDPWFRPVQVRTGMDGALWVVDMYRYVIEHPIWIPPDTLATLDPRAGSTKGRIYRVVRDDHPPRPRAALHKRGGADLAAALDSPNGTQRDIVQQQIQWTQDKATIPGLQALATSNKRPEIRVQALATLANLDGLSADILLTLLGDTDEHIRRYAVEYSEKSIAESPELVTTLQGLATDSSATVRLQLAYTVGAFKPSDAAMTLATLLAKNESDPHLMSAAQSSLTGANVVDVLTQLKAIDASANVVDQILAQAATMAESTALFSILQALSSDATSSPSTASMNRLSRFLEAGRKRTESGLNFAAAETGELLHPALNAAVHIAMNADLPEDERAAAVMLLSHGTFLNDSRTTTIGDLLSPRTSPRLQSTAIAALRKDGSDFVPDMILVNWATRGPGLRKECVALLLSRPTWTIKLLSAIAAGEVAATELDLPQQQALLDHPQENIQETASHSFQPRTSAARQEAIHRYTAAMNENGDSGKGRQVFQKHCSGCHRVQDLGHVVGPDISTYSGKPVQSLLIAMLDPNQAIDPRYQAYLAVLNDGRSVTGIIAEEAASSLTLMAAEAKRETVLRSEVEQIRSTGKSLMPEGFEQNASVTDVNDLWAFLRSVRLPPKSLEGNAPAIVDVPVQGNVALLASQAEIYGNDITFETPFQNIGYWHAQDDHVRWRVRSSESRRVAVWAEWACDTGAEGNKFLIEGVDPALKSTVRSTGAWSRYQLVFLGETLIRAGESEITMRPAESPRTPLVDLRALHLVRVGGVPLATGMVAAAKADAKLPTAPGQIAAWLLDDKHPAAERERLIAASWEKAGEIIPLMAAGLPPERGSKEEYRRIPWIWRVAIAVGKGRDDSQIRSVLATSMPADGQPLQHWQSVVIGGGLINGIGLAGEWPDKQLATVIGEDSQLLSSWQRSLELSVKMADDESVPTGTRYDALRMVAMIKTPAARQQLERYLAEGTNAELQMGAVSGLSDRDEDGVAGLMIQASGYLPDVNLKLAVESLTRDERRSLELLDAIRDSKFSAAARKQLNESALLQHSSERVRLQAVEVLK